MDPPTVVSAVPKVDDGRPEDEGYIEFLHFLQSPTLGVGCDERCLLDLEGESREPGNNNPEPTTISIVSHNSHTLQDKEANDGTPLVPHPQGTHATHEVRDTTRVNLEGKERLSASNSDLGHGFDEDGSSREVDAATAISGLSLPVEDESTTSKGMLSPDTARFAFGENSVVVQRLKRLLTYRIPVVICRAFVTRFLKSAIIKGELRLKLNDGTLLSFGDKTPCEGDIHPVTARVFDDWFFVLIATEHDLGLARSYLAGHFLVEPLAKTDDYPWRLRSHAAFAQVETNGVIGDPLGLIRLFLLFSGNRNKRTSSLWCPKHHTLTGVLQNASGFVISKIGSYINLLQSKLFPNNLETSLKCINEHYDTSTDLYRMLLDKDTLMHSTVVSYATSLAIEVGRPSRDVFKGILEDAQAKKLDIMCDYAQLKKGQTVLDIGFGWAGLSVYAAKKYGCHVTCITLSMDDKTLAEDIVKKEGVDHLITLEVADYHTFARHIRNKGKFDRVICGEIEALSQEHMGEFFCAVEQVMKYGGLLVMEAITSPKLRYEACRSSTDFINNAFSPPGITPSFHSWIDELYRWSTLKLEHVDNIGLHYAETLAEWRCRFNANEESIRKMGYDDVFMRLWNYYMTYYESGFRSQTEYCLVLVLSRPDDKALAPSNEFRSMAQLKTFTKKEVDAWLD